MCLQKILIQNTITYLHLDICKISKYLAIAEHSMCQPGLPGPHDESQEGSPGFDAFHRAKSKLLLLNI